MLQLQMNYNDVTTENPSNNVNYKMFVNYQNIYLIF